MNLENFSQSDEYNPKKDNLENPGNDHLIYLKQLETLKQEEITKWEEVI
jgi:hypothetical protein